MVEVVRQQQPVSDRRQKLRGTGQPPVEESRWHVTRQAGQCARKRIAHIIEYTISSTWGYDHSKEIVSSPILTLIDDWINNGAQE